MLIKVNQWLNIIQQTLLPPTCILCNFQGVENIDLCLDCLEDLPRSRFSCYQCGIALEQTNSALTVCGACLNHPPEFDRSFACCDYDYSSRFLISQLKFNKQFKIARLAAQLMARELDHNRIWPELLVAIPLHNKRLRERGFNQSNEIARNLADLLHLPLARDLLIRDKDTPHQTQLSKSERQKNLRNAFSVSRAVKATHIALIDDVMTTGSTLNAAAQVFKRAGVKTVEAWVFARTQYDN